jgi:hypothetical protein
MKPNHCAIVTDEGQDAHGKTWEPNKEEIHSISSSVGKSDESTTNVSATCDICNAAFSSREALKQHTIREHTDNTSEAYNE